MMRFLILFSALLFFYSCKESTPSGIIEPKKMEAILWDIVRADVLSQELVKKDSSRSLADQHSRLTNEVFLIHNVSREQFERSYSYYVRHPDILRAMLDSIYNQKSRNDTVEMPVRPNLIKDDSVKNN